MDLLDYSRVDALVSTVVGLWITVYALRNRSRLRIHPNLLVRALPFLGPIVLAIGLVRLGIARSPEFTWKRVSTTDQRASAEFPSETTKESSSTTLSDIRINQESISCNVPKRGINLRLGFNYFPQESASLTVEQRLDGVRAFFEQQGFAMISCDPEDREGGTFYRIVVESERQDAQMVIRLAFTSDANYRAVATSTAGFHNDPIIARFVSSFRLE